MRRAFCAHAWLAFLEGRGRGSGATRASGDDGSEATPRQPFPSLPASHPSSPFSAPPRVSRKSQGRIKGHPWAWRRHTAAMKGCGSGGMLVDGDPPFLSALLRQPHFPASASGLRWGGFSSLPSGGEVLMNEATARRGPFPTTLFPRAWLMPWVPSLRAASGYALCSSAAETDGYL